MPAAFQYLSHDQTASSNKRYTKVAHLTLSNFVKLYEITKYPPKNKKGGASTDLYPQVVKISWQILDLKNVNKVFNQDTLQGLEEMHSFCCGQICHPQIDLNIATCL